MPYSGPRVRTEKGLKNGIGPRVAERRQQMALTQDQVCGRIADVTNGEWSPRWADVSRIEHGDRFVSDLEVQVLSRVLDCSTAWMLLGNELASDLKKANGQERKATPPDVVGADS